LRNTRNQRNHRRLGALALLCAAALCPAAGLAESMKLTVRGLDNEARQNLRAHIGEVDAALGAQEARLQRVLKRAVRDALQPLGYYEAQFSVVRDGARLLIDVEPGPRVVFAAPEIAVDEPAASLPAIRELLGSGALAAGKPLSHADYDRFRDELLRGCLGLGFFDAKYRLSELRIDLAARKMLANGIVMIYSFTVTFAIVKALDAIMGIRVDAETESQGLDVVEHVETAYNFGERSMGRAH